MAYNTASYYLDKHDLYLFSNRVEANEFDESNVSEFDKYKVINISCISDVLRNIASGGQLSEIRTEGTLTVKDLIIQKTNFMNQKNFDYLKDQVKFTGFGDALENELKEKMQKQSPEFQISHHAKFGNDTTVATLHFKRSD